MNNVDLARDSKQGQEEIVIASVHTLQRIQNEPLSVRWPFLCTRVFLLGYNAKGDR